jgi:hypothetical protein
LHVTRNFTSDSSNVWTGVPSSAGPAGATGQWGANNAGPSGGMWGAGTKENDWSGGGSGARRAASNWGNPRDPRSVRQVVFVAMV